jgi:Zn-dependent protease with chaperone function
MATDFFDREARAHKQTRLLLWLFGSAVLVVVALVYVVLASVLWAFQHPLFDRAWWNPMTLAITWIFLLGEALVHPLRFLGLIWNPWHFLWLSLGTSLSIAAGCLYKIRLLSSGGPAVAELLGGRKIESDTRNTDEQRLRNVVEEMAIASGMAVPEIYVLDRERGLNTFAAGHTREDVAIGVTFGALKLLTRDELQGVIAHEFSHVLNGDTRLNMKLMGLAHGLMWPTIVGRVLVRGNTREPLAGESIFDADADTTLLPTAPIGFIFLLAGSISSPFVRLIKCLICCQREWLADAAAVQFTRNPAGIEGALKKVGGLTKAGRLDSPHAESASHLYFVNSRLDPWFGLQATHPPLTKRILAIDPEFDGELPHVKSLPIEQAMQSREAAYDYQYQESLRRARAEAEEQEKNL